jgi:hypothetical protein
MVQLAYLHGLNWLIGAAILLGWMAASNLRDGGVITLRVGWLEVRARRR